MQLQYTIGPVCATKFGVELPIDDNKMGHEFNFN